MSARSTDLSIVAKLIAIAAGNVAQAAYLAESTRAPESVRTALKAAANAGSTTAPSFAAALVETEITSAFIEGLRSRSVLARLLADGTTRVPLRTRVGAVIANATAWVTGEGMAIPVGMMALAGPSLVERKAAGLLTVTSELLRSTSPAGRALLDASLRSAVAGAVDASFLDVIADGVASLPASGPTAANALSDLRSMLDAVNTVGAGALFWVMAPDVANAGSTLAAASGELLFTGLSPTGGELLGVPALVTSGLVSGTLMLIDASGIAAEIESISVDYSDQAVVQMDDAPTSPPGSATVLQSMWQTNRVAILGRALYGAEIIRPGSVAVLDGVAWSN